MPVPDENGNPYFDVVFGLSGNLTAVPDAVQANGSISYTSGWGAYYAQDPTVDPATALFIDRAQTNQLFNDITKAIQAYQQFGTPAFITSAMNGGTPFTYAQYARVVHNGVLYQSLVGGNTDTPPSAKWEIGGGGRVLLAANTAYYVNGSTGSDSTGTGASGNPWATIQHAINYLYQNLDTGGYAVTVNVADYVSGYAPFAVSGQIPGGGSLAIIGDTGTPTNCPISSNSASCIVASNGAVISIGGFSVSTGGSNNNGVEAYTGSQINITGAMNYGACSGNHIYSEDNSTLYTTGTTYTISGGAFAHLYCNNGGYLNNASCTVTLSGTPAFSTAFAVAQFAASLDCASNTYSGGATGSRYLAQFGIINTSSGNPNFFPGNSGGTAPNGGQYL